MLSKLTLSQAHWEAMQRHVASQASLEACGLLAGRETQVEAVLPIANAAQSPLRYRMEPMEQIRAFEWIESHSLELLGIYHSHPNGPGDPSASDRREAAYPVVYLIWTQRNGQWGVRGFWIEADMIDQVELEITDSK
jgi:proteasome lid subunit RPN8/RPN11